jgi:hypothetical protein
MQFWMNLTRSKPDLESAIKVSSYGLIKGIINPIYKADEIRSKILGQYTYLEPLAEKNPLNLAEIIKFKMDAITPLKFQGFGFIFDVKNVGIAVFSHLKHDFSCQFGAYYDVSDWANPKFLMSINAMFEAGIDYVFLNSSTLLPDVIEEIVRLHDRTLYKTRIISECEDKDADDVLTSGVHGLLLKDYEYVSFFEEA